MINLLKWYASSQGLLSYLFISSKSDSPGLFVKKGTLEHLVYRFVSHSCKSLTLR